MGIFGSSKKTSPAHAAAPISAPRAIPDVLSPLWSEMPRIEPEPLRHAPLPPEPAESAVLVCASVVSSNELEPQDEVTAGALVLRLVIPCEWLADMELDPHVEWFLERVDGKRTIDDIFGEGIRREETMRELFELLEEGVVTSR